MKNTYTYNLQREADDWGSAGNWYPQYLAEKNKNTQLQNQLALQKELIEELDFIFEHYDRTEKFPEHGKEIYRKKLNSYKEKYK